jgi:hypothetical protein
MPNSLEQVINLIKKTGDNCVVLDSQGQPAYVVLDFTAYQNLIDGLKPEGQIERINQDIANWKAQEENFNPTNNWQAVKEVMSQSPKYSHEGNLADKKLNQANNSQSVVDESQHYYFEPID